MRTNISHIPCLFIGFKEHPDEVDSIISLLKSELRSWMDQNEAWNIVAKVLDLNNIDNIIFTISSGICFCRVK